MYKVRVRASASKTLACPEYVMKMMDEIKRGCQPTLYKKRAYQLPDDELSIGHETHAFIRSQDNLQLEGFFSDVRKYFTTAVDYMVSKFPYGDELLQHAAVADISRRQTVTFSSLGISWRGSPAWCPRESQWMLLKRISTVSIHNLG